MRKLLAILLLFIVGCGPRIQQSVIAGSPAPEYRTYDPAVTFQVTNNVRASIDVKVGTDVIHRNVSPGTTVEVGFPCSRPLIQLSRNGRPLNVRHGTRTENVSVVAHDGSGAYLGTAERTVYINCDNRRGTVTLPLWRVEYVSPPRAVRH